MKRISKNQAQAIYNALLEDNLWLVFTIEFPEAAAIIERSMKPQKRTVAISRDGVTTVFDAEWLKAMRDDYDDTIAGFEAGTGRM